MVFSVVWVPSTYATTVAAVVASYNSPQICTISSERTISSTTRASQRVWSASSSWTTEVARLKASVMLLVLFRVLVWFCGLMVVMMSLVDQPLPTSFRQLSTYSNVV
ncbi:hypothetical protein BGZ63DRAFT_379199 [Mariannaea sp. PMI_226]|nr:hypothetical protein BGZ63DRAFT_379199 [Mariannaea sp. PMI_226]